MAIQNDVQNAELAYLLFPFEQYSNLNGKPLVGGHIEVFEAGTDNRYLTYQDWNGDYNPFKIPIPEDGRIVALADPSLAYDVYCYDSFNNLVCSRLNLQCNVPGSISIKGADTRINNTDGTLDIELRTLGNNVRQYTINTRNKLLDVQDPLYFVENSTTATVIGIKGGTVPEGTMNESALGYQDGQITGYNGSALGGNSELTLRTNGIKDGTYNTLGTYTPQGGAKNIDIPREVYTFTIGNNSCFYNDVIMAYLNSKVVVALEIESWYEDGQQKQNVYENFAQKQFWGDTNFYNGGYVNFVRVDVEKNQIVTWKCEPETQGSITGYAKWTKTVTDLGSGGLFIAEYGAPGTTYEEIDAAFNAGKTIIAHKKDGNIDQYYQLCEIRKYPPEHTPNVDCYVFANRYSYIAEELFRFQSNWSNLETRLATWDYVNQQISAGNFATKEYVESATSGKMDVTGMTAYQPTGDYATHDDLTAYQPVGDYYSASNPSGFITNDAITGLQPSGDYVTHDEMTGYQPVGDYYSASNPSGFITNDAITGLQPSGDYATHDDLTGYATTSLVSSVSSELYSAISSISGDYELVAGSGVELVDDPNAKTTTINVTAEGTPVTAIEQMIESATSGLQPSGDYANAADLANYQPITAMTAYQEAGDYYSASNPSGFIDANALAPYQTIEGMTAYQPAGDYQPSGDYVSATELANYQTVEGMTAYQEAGDYLSATESANYYPMTGNPSGFLTEHQDLSDYQLTADMTAYATIESLTAKQDAGDYYSASNPSGFISEIPDTYLQNTDLSTEDGKVTAISGIPLSAGGDVPEGVMVESAVGFNAVNEISGYNGSAIAQYGAEKQWLVHDDTIVHVANSAQYAFGVNLSAVAQLLGVDETVLFSGTSAGANLTAETTLNESMRNFERIRFYFGSDVNHGPVIEQNCPIGSNYYFNFAVPGGETNCWVQYAKFSANSDFSKIKLQSVKAINYGAFGSTGSVTLTAATADNLCRVQKIIGIGRKQ